MILPHTRAGTKKIFTARQNFIHSFVLGHPEFLIITCSLVLSIVSSYSMLIKDSNSLLYYDDAISHSIIARRVIDSITPGLAQFGTVWLPIIHLFLIPFVANNFLFQTGLSGTIVSGVATAVAAMFLFRIVRLHFDSPYAGFLASALFLMNTSVIYMSIVPMMEATFMMFSMMASYYALKWYKLHDSGNDLWSQYRSLLKCSIAITAASLTRYEGWFFPLGLVIMILIVLSLGRKEHWKHKVEAFLLISGVYSLIGIVLWIIYNGTIFRNPLLFLLGPYSSQAQAITRPYRQHLFLQPGNVISSLFGAATDMYGLHVVILSLVGIAIFLYMRGKRSLLFSFLTLAALSFPLLVDMAVMIGGVGEIYFGTGGGWFNGRYLIFLSPLFAFSSTALVVFVATKSIKILTGGTVILVLLFYGITMILNPLQLGATTALSDNDKLIPSRNDVLYDMDAAKAIKKIYTGGRIAEFTLSKSSPILQMYSGVPLKEFIDINNKDYWQDSEIHPWTHVRYIILQKPVDASSGLHINQTDFLDPMRINILHWNKNLRSIMSPLQQTGNSLLSSVSIVYENPNFFILKNEQKNFVLERIFDGLESSSKIAVVGNNDILVTEKKTGQIYRIVDGNVLSKPLLDVTVDARGELGIFDIATTKNATTNSTYVFLYYPEVNTQSMANNSNYGEPLGNRLYRYDLVDNKLVNPRMLLDLPTGTPDDENIGEVIIGPDDNVYVLVGDMGNVKGSGTDMKMQNNIIIEPEGGQIKIINKPQYEMTQAGIKSHNKTATIFKVSQDDKPVLQKEFFKEGLIDRNGYGKYYLSGIANALTMDFDPITHNLWYVGSKDNHNLENLNKSDNPSNSKINYIESLIHTNITGIDNQYRSTQFMWNESIGLSTIKFLNSDALGKQYENDLFAGDLDKGNLYYFDLNKNRTSLYLNGSLADKISDNDEAVRSQVFLTGLGGITDIEVGSDGYLYFTAQDNLLPKEDDLPNISIYRLRAVGN